MARFTPFTEAMEMRSAWCDTNERREWGGYAGAVNARALSLTRIEQAHIASREGGALLSTPHARGGSDPPQRLHHMLVERSAPPSLEAMCACSKAVDLSG